MQKTKRTSMAGLGGCALLVIIFSGCSEDIDIQNTVDESPEINEEVNVIDDRESPEKIEQLEAEQPPEEPVTLETKVENSDSFESGISFEVTEETGDAFWLKVSATKMSNVFGLAFYVNYNTEVIEYVEAISENILEDNFTEVSKVVRHEPGQFRYGIVRIHDPGNYGQPPEYTGIDIEEGVVVRIQFRKVSAGDTELHIPDIGKDLRDNELDVQNLNVRETTITLHQVEVQE